MDGRVVAAQRTGGVAPVADFAEGHGQGIVKQHAIDKRVSFGGDELDRLHGLNRAHNPGEWAQHAHVRLLPDGAGGRRFGIEAAVAAASREEDRDLTFDAEDAAVDQGLLQEEGGVAQEIAGAEGIGPIEDEVVAAEEVHGVGLIHGTGSGFDADLGVESIEGALGRTGLFPAHVDRRVHHLALQVGEPNPIVVDQAQRAYPGGGEVQGRGGPERAHPHDQDARLQQAMLAADADLGERKVSGVALLLGAGEGMMRHGQARTGRLVRRGTALKIPW